MTAAPAGDDELARAVVREALAEVGAEERALLRVALTRASGDVDKDTEQMLKLLVRFDDGRCAALLRAERWALAGALRRFRGMTWTGSFEAAQVHGADADEPAQPTTAGA